MSRLTRKGFTLVELLIVIVVIGILAAMMMISSTEAVSSAKVAAVLANMRNLKTAITAWYLENTDKIERGNNGTGAYLVRWSNNYSGNDNLTPIQELWDSRVKRSGETQDTTSFKAIVLRYMENSDRVTATNRKTSNWNNNDSAYGGYVLEDNGGGENRTQWFLGYVVDNESMKKKFSGRAKSLGLLQENKKNSKVYTNGDIVWMRVLSFE